MNRLKSILLGSLLAAASITVISQNANADEVKYQRDNFHQNTVAFDHPQFQRERQIRERQARQFRERQAREQRARQFRERQAREQRAREFRERQARFDH